MTEERREAWLEGRLASMEAEVKQLVRSFASLEAKLCMTREACPYQVDISRNSDTGKRVDKVEAGLEVLREKLVGIELKLAGWAVIMGLVSGVISVALGQLVKGWIS